MRIWISLQSADLMSRDSQIRLGLMLMSIESHPYKLRSTKLYIINVRQVPGASSLNDINRQWVSIILYVLHCTRRSLITLRDRLGKDTLPVCNFRQTSPPVLVTAADTQQ